jgi:hypothetical protein
MRIAYVAAAVLACCAWSQSPLFAQADRRGFVGALIGISTLSADGRAITAPPDAMISMYKPENGIALNALVGWHLARYFSLQANYITNRNDLTLISSVLTAQGGTYYEQTRNSRQHAVVADGLVYFRPVESRLRPYLGTGLAVVQIASEPRRTVFSGLPAPAHDTSSVHLALRSRVGIDFALSRRVSMRYSFSETISANPISRELSPPGQRGLANFQNLFGVIGRF